MEVSGTKWCGKTWPSLAHAESVTYVDRGQNLQIVRAEPSWALAGEQPHVIDEWQLARDVFALEDGVLPTEGQALEVSRHLSLLRDVYLMDEVPG